MLGNIGFAADKIIVGKLDKVGIKENNFDFLRRLFGAVGANGNGLFIVCGKGHIIVFQSSFSHFRS